MTEAWQSVQNTDEMLFFTYQRIFTPRKPKQGTSGLSSHMLNRCYDSLTNAFRIGKSTERRHGHNKNNAKRLPPSNFKKMQFHKDTKWHAHAITSILLPQLELQKSSEVDAVIHDISQFRAFLFGMDSTRVDDLQSVSVIDYKLIIPTFSQILFPASIKICYNKIAAIQKVP